MDTQIIPNSKPKTLLTIMKEMILHDDGIVYRRCSVTMRWMGAFRHFRLNHSKSLGKGQTLMNWIEKFLDQAKHYLRKYIPRHQFINFFSKKCERRFHTQSPQEMLKEHKGCLKEESTWGILYASLETS